MALTPDSLLSPPASEAEAVERQRAWHIGELLAAGRIADLDPDAVRWFVERAARLEHRLRRLQQNAADLTAEASAALGG